MAVLSFSSLPLGFRFRPTDEELVDYYLRLKINGNDNDVRVIREIDVCKREPWELPDLSVIPTRDPEWFFFCPLDRKYPNGHRSNRATIAGYWKATGKDRKIKSGVTLIGMKKTLVFHTGRAPKGKRTNWVMHEYRATQKELDGTNPGQSAYVLCRLFKKQDESIEDSNCDGVEPTVSSPTASNFSPEEMQSEGALVQKSPVLNEKRPTKAECCLAENFNGTDSDCLAPVECHKNGYDAEDKVVDVTAKEVDLQMEEDLDLFNEPILEPLDCKIFSPLHSQMQMELGSSSMFSVTNDLSSVYSEVQFQYGTNESDTSTSDFLNSVLNNTDEYFCGETIKNLAIEGETPKNTVFLKEGESCSGSYAKEAKALVETTPGDYQTPTSEYDVDEGTKNLVLLRNNPYKRDSISSGSGVEPFCNMIDNLEGLTSDTNETGRGDTGTGIRTRPRQPQNDPCIENSVSQGTAPRRLHLQLNLAEPDHSIKKSRDWVTLQGSADYHEPRYVLQLQMGNITEEHSSAGDSNASTSTMDEPQKTYPFGSREDSKFIQELSAGMRPKFRALSKKSTSEKVPPVLSKTPTHHSNWSIVYISRVIVLVVVVFITSVGIWKWLEF